MNEKINNFVKWYDSLEPDKKRDVREEFLRRSGLRYPSWFYKIKKKSFQPLEMQLLEDITGQTYLRT